jgi:mannose-6-phosphate isomerase-like protein (cupin superfamily)
MDTRRNAIAMMSTALFAAVAAPLPGKTSPWIKAPEDGRHITAPFGEVHVYYKGETDQLRLLETLRVRVNPGYSPPPPHQHPEEEILLVVEGEGEFLLDGQASPCAAGTMLYAAPGHSHGINNTGSEPLTLHVFKWQPK